MKFVMYIFEIIFMMVIERIFYMEKSRIVSFDGKHHSFFACKNMKPLILIVFSGASFELESVIV